MSQIRLIGSAVLSAVLIGGAAIALAGNNPVDEKWWPSEFGADDQAGHADGCRRADDSTQIAGCAFAAGGSRRCSGR